MVFFLLEWLLARHDLASAMYFFPLRSMPHTGVWDPWKVIRLTVDRGCHGGDRPSPPTIEDEANGALVPPLDLVIRTRWPGATVDWNGTDPILWTPKKRNSGSEVADRSGSIAVFRCLCRLSCAMGGFTKRGVGKHPPFCAVDNVVWLGS